LFSIFEVALGARTPSPASVAGEDACVSKVGCKGTKKSFVWQKKQSSLSYFILSYIAGLEFLSYLCSRELSEMENFLPKLGRKVFQNGKFASDRIARN